MFCCLYTNIVRSDRASSEEIISQTQLNFNFINENDLFSFEIMGRHIVLREARPIVYGTIKGVFHSSSNWTARHSFSFNWYTSQNIKCLNRGY